MRFITALLFSSLLNFAISQNIVIESTISQEVSICDTVSTHHVKIRNDKNHILSNVTLGISLPSGIVYETGSFSENTSLGVSITRIKTDSGLVFSSNNIGIGDSVEFEISYRALQSTIALQNTGYVFRNNVSISHSSGSENQNSISYNILYPALSITSATPSSETIISGTSTTRDVRVINGGYGRVTELWITDITNIDGLTLDSTNYGSISGDSIHLTGDDFSSVGNNDAFLDRNEAIVVTEYLTGVTCTDKTVTTTLNAYWGCSGDFIKTSSNTYTNILIDFQSPDLVVSTNESFDACFGTGLSYAQEISIRNRGSGVASDVLIDLYKSKGKIYDYNMLTRIDQASVRYTVGINGSSVVPTMNLTNSAPSPCLGGTPTGRLDFTISSIDPGDTVFIYFDMVPCCITTCSNLQIKGWKVDVDYEDVCGTKQYSETKVGQNDNSQKMTVFSESPADLYNNQAENFTYMVTKLSNNLPQGTGAHYLAEFELDEDLVYESLSFESNGTVWTPTSITYDAVTRKVTAKYPLPAPFNVTRSELDLELKGVCGTSGWKEIKFSFSYVADTTCIGSCPVPLICDNIIESYLHCPGAVCEGLAFNFFEAIRNSLGEPDNDQDGLPDASGILNLNEIKTNRAMVGDTIKVIVKGSVHSSSSTWNYASFSTENDYGSVVDYTSANLRLYDASNSTWYTLDGLSGSTSTNGRRRTFTVDLSQSTLGSKNGSLSSFSYSNGDSLELEVYLKVVDNVSGNIRESTFDNEFYVSTTATPNSSQKLQCNVRHGRMTLIAYGFKNSGQNYYQLNNCSKKVNQGFGMKLANVYGGGNIFPYEYRNWGHLKEARVIVPDDYTISSASIRQFSTEKTNATVREDIDISYDTTYGNTYIFDVEALYDNGDLRRSDDGYHGTLYVTLEPLCNLVKNRYHEIFYEFDYQKSTAIDGETSGLITAKSDRIIYQPAEIQMTSENPIQSTTSKLVTWDLNVENTQSNAEAAYGWLYLDVPTNIEIDSVKNTGTGQLLTATNGFYQYGTLDENDEVDYLIYGNFSSCDSSTFDAHFGYSCDKYPISFDSFYCQKSSITLGVDPKEAQYQVRIANEEMADPCVPEVTLSLDIISVDIAHMYDMSISVITPDTSRIKIIDGSTEFASGNATFSSASNPSISNNTYTYEISDYEPDYLDNGIPGILSIPDNNYKIKFDLKAGIQYEPSDVVYIHIAGSDACGDTVPTTILAYDMNSNFRKDNTAGLSLDLENSWSASWGDYDNDGYDDLFIPVNTIGEPNILYRNNQNGTFTKVTTGPIVNETGSSIAGVWGDYDNDGYIDLFVANNINSSNRLYHNNGNGTFSEVKSSPIVELGVYSHAAAWADYNRDGNLDLVVSDYHPTNFNFLFYGDGAGGFSVDEISDVGLSATSAVGVSWGDYDNDGDLDLFIANTNGENNSLYENQGGVMKALTSGAIVTDGGHSVGGTWGDYDNDGDLDLYVTNSRREEKNFFYENDGDGTFTKILSGAIVDLTSNSNGASWIDYNNDGHLDLMVANDQNQPNFLFRNNGDKSFSSISNIITQDESDSYGVAWSDFDNDGDYDLVVANKGSNVNDLFINGRASCTNHIIFALEGCNSNSKGIGTRIAVKATIDGQDVWQIKHVATQNSGMGGQNSSNLLFGLGNATSIDSAVIYWPSGITTYLNAVTLNATNTVVEQCGSQVCGTVYHDENSNGIKDSTENGVPNQTIVVNPGGYRAFTGSDGTYQFYLEDGNYTLDLETNPNWSQATPISNGSINLIINNSTQATYCGNEFTTDPQCAYSDLAINMGTTAMRRGLLNDLNINVSNQGAFDTDTTMNLEVRMSDDIYLVDTSYTSVSVANNIRTYKFEISGLEALTDTTFGLIDSVDVNATLGDTVEITAEIQYPSQECSADNNSASMSDVIVGSIDPNDKLVFVSKLEETKFKRNETSLESEDLLSYKIRFQNLGNYAARRVQIIDTLSADLDWSTFEMLSSSHPFSVSIRDGIVTWINERIELPDVFSDEEGSNGYVMFSIQPKVDLPRYSVVHNTAYIQFDRNPYIQTNTASAVAGIGDYASDQTVVIVYPNPTRDKIKVLLVDEEQRPIEMQTVEVVDPNGTTVYRIDPTELKISINLGDLASGLYSLKIITTDGNQYYKRVVKL